MQCWLNTQQASHNHITHKAGSLLLGFLDDKSNINISQTIRHRNFREILTKTGSGPEQGSINPSGDSQIASILPPCLTIKFLFDFSICSHFQATLLTAPPPAGVKCSMSVGGARQHKTHSTPSSAQTEPSSTRSTSSVTGGSMSIVSHPRLRPHWPVLQLFPRPEARWARGWGRRRERHWSDWTPSTAPSRQQMPSTSPSTRMIRQ